MDREYVIVCNEHAGYFPGVLLFWGYHTEDDVERRSFGGYTSDLDACERYTIEEVNASGYHFPVYDKRMSKRDFLECENVVINVEQLKELGYVFKRFAINP